MECPCEECVSFAICNSIIKSMPKRKVKTLANLRQCHDLFYYLNYENYIDKPGRLIFSTEATIRINITRRLYDLEDKVLIYE